MRRARRSPSWEDVYEGVQADAPLMSVLAGHLVIDALMVELIRLQNTDDYGWRMSFMQKVEYCIEHGHLRMASRRAFEMFNSMRNDYAHCLGEHKNEAEIWALVQECLANVEAVGEECASWFKPEDLGETRKERLEWCVRSLYYELSYALSDCGEWSFMPY